MPSLFPGFFILMRFYLRVDNTIIRVHDSRFYFEVRKGELSPAQGSITGISSNSNLKIKE